MKTWHVACGQCRRVAGLQKGETTRASVDQTEIRPKRGPQLAEKTEEEEKKKRGGGGMAAGVRQRPFPQCFV